ncbi:ImmA/IrrE family metallo-endopeptidase [Paenibacillus naphthalenovorans]|uniref:ImmA/IrrE family metallo-endopeptidase n=1 Tax=Paenibacillus naphthalenovorans TaxID=162209 RepID=UPI000885142D|nr:ImmA/IrrE family metallo-endopeptidase [Paenibacillus naphthalenovorans]SDJ82634.1 protein of unknown function [Paenibacillus naphthalenovorans]
MKRLHDHERFEIAELAKKLRRTYELGMGPLGDNIFKLLRTLNIQLVRYPIAESPANTNPFSALYVASSEGGHTMRYIGINSDDYVDKQIFFIAHELFHHIEEISEMVVCRIEDEPNELREARANLFAAELLLPAEGLIYEIKRKNNGTIRLHGWRHSDLLRLIAEIHCDYRLPYKAIVRRLDEIESIKTSQVEALMTEDSRNPVGMYWKYGMVINPSVFEKLNTRTREIGADGENLNKLIENFEASLISRAELAEDLELFHKTLEDFGLEDSIAEEEDEDLALLYTEESDED